MTYPMVQTMQTTFGSRLKSSINLRGLTIAEVSEQSGVSTRNVYDYLHDDITPQPYNLNRLASTLAVSAYWLMHGGDDDSGD
jgi:transcriptional regulator with XRE-family HTH domain